MAQTQGTRSNAGRGQDIQGGKRGGRQGDNRDTAGDGGDRQGSSQGGNRGGSERGFAAMDAERQREIASMGGRAAHRQGTAHEFDSEEARAAGRRGGEVVSQNRQHMAAIGALGGRASRGGGARSRSSTALANAADMDQQDPTPPAPLPGGGLGVTTDADRQASDSGTQGSSSRH